MQTVEAESQTPQTVEAQQHRRRVAAAATETPGYRNALEDRDLDALAQPGVATQLLRGARGQVPFVGRHARVVGAHTDAALPRRKLDVVAQFDRLEQRAQLVVAVLPRAEHFEAQVDLGEGAKPHDGRTRRGTGRTIPAGTAARRRSSGDTAAHRPVQIARASSASSAR